MTMNHMIIRSAVQICGVGIGLLGFMCLLFKNIHLLLLIQSYILSYRLEYSTQTRVLHMKTGVLHPGSEAMDTKSPLLKEALALVISVFVFNGPHLYSFSFSL